VPNTDLQINAYGASYSAYDHDLVDAEAGPVVGKKSKDSMSEDQIELVPKINCPIKYFLKSSQSIIIKGNVSQSYEYDL
jgi:hypothetical protein